MKLKKMVALLLALLLAMSLLTACGKTDNTKSDGDGKVTVNENGEWMPSESVTLLVGWDAGGGLDTLARALAPRWVSIWASMWSSIICPVPMALWRWNTC